MAYVTHLTHGSTPSAESNLLIGNADPRTGSAPGPSTGSGTGLTADLEHIPAAIQDRAAALHRESIVVDTLNTSPLNQDQIERFRQGGVTAFNWTVAHPLADWEATLDEIGHALRSIQAHRHDVLLATCADDIVRAKAEGRLAAILGFQNARPIGDNLDRVHALHQLGLRIIQLTYNTRNFVGDGCAEPTNSGLSRLGRRLVCEFNETGILVDLSHCGAQTTLDAAAVSTVPVAITHANVRALCDTPRNKTDEEMIAVAQTGGIAGITFWAPLAGSTQRPTMDTMLAHLNHIIETAGENAIVIGSDQSEGIYKSAQEWTAALPGGEGRDPMVTAHVGDWYCYEQRHVAGLESVAKLPAFTATLLAGGVPDEVIKGALGGNFLRVFRAACG